MKRYLKRTQRLIFTRFMATLSLIFLFYCAFKLGIAGGNYFYRTDFKIVKIVDIEDLKSVLDTSLPLINVTYNSGNIGNPFTRQIKKLSKVLSGFDLNSPVTILNSQSSFFYTYYKNIYFPLVAFNDEVGEKNGFDSEEEGNNRGSQNSRGSEDRGVEYENNTGIRGDEKYKDLLEGEIIEDRGRISYYYYEGEEELKLSQENIGGSKQIVIQNTTKLAIDIEALMKEPINIKFDRNGPKIMIFHTHTTESFSKNLTNSEKRDTPNWSLDPQENIVRVGYELAELLKKKYGYDVIHNGTVHDYPDYDNSYNNAYVTLNSYLKSYPSIKVIFDIHRDGLSQNQPKLRLTTKIGDKDVAKIMFVVGTNAKKSGHSNWKENLKLAIKLQDSLNKQHPDLARHIYISNNVYNQDLSTGALIVEIGGDGNLLEECLESVKYLAKAINEVIN